MLLYLTYRLLNIGFSIEHQIPMFPFKTYIEKGRKFITLNVYLDLDLIAVICHFNMILSCQTLQIILNGAYLYIIVMGVASILILDNPSPFRTKYQDN